MQKVQMHTPLREKQRQEREALILETAERVFLEKGYHETSIDEIATRVGVAKGTIYLHFASKEDLVKAIVQRSMVAFVRDVKDAVASKLTPGEKIETLLLRIYTRFFREEIRLLYSLYSNPEMKRLAEEEHGHSAKPFINELIELVTEIIEAGKAAKEFDSSLPTPVMVSIFFCLISPRTGERLFNEYGFTPAELASHLARIYFRGISAH
ncbi:MAG: TetR/AcrR family transcriptional regulator [Ktedonobacteraceae bacterium]|nr:TetR/AcrR family transcriptional regulator [Ktedonobacteraceae bacterium]